MVSSNVLTGITVIRVSQYITTSYPVIQLTAVTVRRLVVHLQSRSLHTSAWVGDLSHRNHCTSVYATSEQSRVIQQFPAVLVEGVASASEGLEAQLHSHVGTVVECAKLSGETGSNLSSDTLSQQVIDSQVETSVQVHSVLCGSPLLIQFDDDVVNILHTLDGTTVYVTTSLNSREVTLCTSYATISNYLSAKASGEDVTKQQSHLTLIHEALTSLLFAVHEPSVVSVSEVNPADIGSLRTVDLETLFYNSKRVNQSIYSGLSKPSGLV